MKLLFSILDAGVGGGQRVAIEVARRLASQGNRIGLFVPNEGPAAEEFRALGAAVHMADLRTLRHTSGVAPASALARDYDLLYSHTSVPGEILGARVVELAKITHVVHRHTDPYFSSRALARSFQKRLYRRELRAARFIAVAAHVGASLELLGIECGRIAVVPNGVDVEVTRERRRGAVQRYGQFTVGALGRFDPSRGLDVFTQAARRVHEPGVTMVIGGASGPFHEHEAAVRRSAGDIGVEVEHPGSSGVEFLASLDVVVIPSRYEGSPVTLFEAMALGKPIVASRIPGIAEVLETSGAGVLVPPGDPESLANAIRSLVADPARREVLGRTALQTVRREHDLDNVLDRVVGVLRRAARVA